ncbi:glycoside hydrolase family 19 protein [Sphingomonas sp.]|jgi:putative chitinase|uniref:glycoside hydrolase family 19 protein n=1 Tax=Sphingomonas sp. TaxID=28214 RepID=UPI002D7F1EE5|nr:glycoside hydrolase family 19 protein [Sphingomonas sp.]HEU0045066.1 glycoside hydrolase family 19 protein [Sphingomonas sp.]
MTRSALFEAVRPFAPDQRFTPVIVAQIDGVADALGLPREVANHTTGLTDPVKFFTLAKDVLGPLAQHEVDGCNAIVAACGVAGWPIADTAYALATAFHETAGTMQPIKEHGGLAYLTRMYDITGARPAKARELGNLQPGDGSRYCGRGYVQLTGRTNYEKASRVVEVDLVAAPDRAMEAPIAAKIMVSGMQEGWFTSRDLDDDLPRAGPATLRQFVLSRDIINGSDKAEKIAAEAVEFQEALVAGGWAPL